MQALPKWPGAACTWEQQDSSWWQVWQERASTSHCSPSAISPPSSTARLKHWNHFKDGHQVFLLQCVAVQLEFNVKWSKDPPGLLYKTDLLKKGKTKNGLRKLFLTVRCLRSVTNMKKKKQSAWNIKNCTKMENPRKYRTSESTEEQASNTTALFVTHKTWMTKDTFYWTICPSRLLVTGAMRKMAFQLCPAVHRQHYIPCVFISGIIFSFTWVFSPFPWWTSILVQCRSSSLGLLFLQLVPCHQQCCQRCYFLGKFSPKKEQLYKIMQDIKGAVGLCGLGSLSHRLNINPERQAYLNTISITGGQMPT